MAGKMDEGTLAMQIGGKHLSQDDLSGFRSKAEEGSCDGNVRMLFQAQDAAKLDQQVLTKTKLDQHARDIAEVKEMLSVVITNIDRNRERADEAAQLLAQDVQDILHRIQTTRDELEESRHRWDAKHVPGHSTLLDKEGVGRSHCKVVSYLGEAAFAKTGHMAVPTETWRGSAPGRSGSIHWAGTDLVSSRSSDPS